MGESDSVTARGSESKLQSREADFLNLGRARPDSRDFGINAKG